MAALDGNLEAEGDWLDVSGVDDENDEEENWELVSPSITRQAESDKLVVKSADVLADEQHEIPPPASKDGAIDWSRVALHIALAFLALVFAMCIVLQLNTVQVTLYRREGPILPHNVSSAVSRCYQGWDYQVWPLPGYPASHPRYRVSLCNECGCVEWGTEYEYKPPRYNYTHTLGRRVPTWRISNVTGEREQSGWVELESKWIGCGDYSLGVGGRYDLDTGTVQGDYDSHRESSQADSIRSYDDPVRGCQMNAGSAASAVLPNLLAREDRPCDVRDHLHNPDCLVPGSWDWETQSVIPPADYHGHAADYADTGDLDANIIPNSVMFKRPCHPSGGFTASLWRCTQGEPYEMLSAGTSPERIIHSLDSCGRRHTTIWSPFGTPENVLFDPRTLMQQRQVDPVQSYENASAIIEEARQRKARAQFEQWLGKVFAAKMEQIRIYRPWWTGFNLGNLVLPADHRPRNMVLYERWPPNPNSEMHWDVPKLFHTSHEVESPHTHSEYASSSMKTETETKTDIDTDTANTDLGAELWWDLASFGSEREESSYFPDCFWHIVELSKRHWNITGAGTNCEIVYHSRAEEAADWVQADVVEDPLEVDCPDCPLSSSWPEFTTQPESAETADNEAHDHEVWIRQLVIDGIEHDFISYSSGGWEIDRSQTLKNRGQDQEAGTLLDPQTTTGWPDCGNLIRNRSITSTTSSPQVTKMETAECREFASKANTKPETSTETEIESDTEKFLGSKLGDEVELNNDIDLLFEAGVYGDHDDKEEDADDCPSCPVSHWPDSVAATMKKANPVATNTAGALITTSGSSFTLVRRREDSVLTLISATNLGQASTSIYLSQAHPLPAQQPTKPEAAPTATTRPAKSPLSSSSSSSFSTWWKSIKSQLVAALPAPDFLPSLDTLLRPGRDFMHLLRDIFNRLHKKLQAIFNLPCLSPDASATASSSSSSATTVSATTTHQLLIGSSLEPTPLSLPAPTKQASTSTDRGLMHRPEGHVQYKTPTRAQAASKGVWQNTAPLVASPAGYLLFDNFAGSTSSSQ